ncbi:hypothetical protein PBY51_014542 [Eleginops maclovinus]|uniref:Uncharacterized protein n=1 Tax=Eleginops maclovinus TaxID=56733 RepID=A0AAN7WZA4_ELEMC|nr:hypothetical protein PBY51_014542 [Eleginops maclovinus]
MLEQTQYSSVSIWVVEAVSCEVSTALASDVPPDGHSDAVGSSSATREEPQTALTRQTFSRRHMLTLGVNSQ